MITLSNTLYTCQIILGGAITTNQLEYSGSYIEISRDRLDSFVTFSGQTNSATAVTMVAAPIAGNKRLIRDLHVYNADTVSATVTIRLNYNSGTFRRLCVVVLTAGQSLIYTSESGFSTI